MKNAIYIGKGHVRTFERPVWFEGIGKLNCSQLHYGMTGNAFYSETDKKWDFRPDGLNIQHLVNRRDLYFDDIIYPI